MTLKIVFTRSGEKKVDIKNITACLFSSFLKLETPNGYKWLVKSAWLLKKTTQCDIYRQRIKQSVYANRMIIRVYSFSVCSPFFSVQFNKFQLLCSHAARSLINRPTKCTAPILNAMWLCKCVSIALISVFCSQFRIYELKSKFACISLFHSALWSFQCCAVVSVYILSLR